MTTGELLVALFEAYRNNDDSAFMKAGMTLIEEEKAKKKKVENRGSAKGQQITMICVIIAICIEENVIFGT